MTRVPLIGWGLLTLLVGWIAYAIVQDHRDQQIASFAYDPANDVLTVFYRDGSSPRRVRRACNPRYQHWWLEVFPSRWPVIEHCQWLFDQAQEHAWKMLMHRCEAQGIPLERCTAAVVESE